MSLHDYLSDDGQALLALCSPFGLSPAELEGDLQPLKLSEWNQLSRQLERAPAKRPSGLAGLAPNEIADQLGIAEGEAERLRRLLDRAGAQAFELEKILAQGIWVTTRLDDSYPARLLATLKEKAPTVLFGAGEAGLFGKPAVAVVGSRNIDAAGTQYAVEIGRKAVGSGLAVVSGGARGTDRLAMNAALEAGGLSLGALADSLEGTLRKPEVRELVLDGRLALVTPYAPDAGFSVGAAMGRNKVIYGLAEFAVVVSSDYQTGGTWAGAAEAIKGDWCPLFVREGADVPKGNRELIKLGGTALSDTELGSLDDLRQWLRAHTRSKIVEQDLF
jgi:predicted Rossmann fold nucleotide-binding protein DprA/Smf involved in DNA uptake